MLFNSFLFVAAFLPVALLGYFGLARVSPRASIAFLFLASLAFYGYANPAFVPLLLGSIAANYAFGRRILRSREAGDIAGAKRALVSGLIFDLGLLGIFKYLDFFVANFDALTGASLELPGIVLPIGISFFTFTQLAWLADCHAGGVREYRPENYGLFVSYFPHLIAGPILHHKEMMPQFEHPRARSFVPGRMVVGSLIFVAGLLKKVVLADGIARFVAPVFDIGHAQLTWLEAWCGALAYTFQLYFDFSAYSDMAYGLSLMFGIVLPINFNSPYQACSIIDFWRRWHITLSRFLRDYLYIPLGGNRRGPARRYLNLFVTMLLGGLWHGANWTFVIWGGLHGIYLALNHALRRAIGDDRRAVVGVLGWAATFLAVVVGWVFFRAASVPVALDVLRAMAGGTYAEGTGSGILGINRIMAVDEALAWIAAAAAIALFLPNVYQLVERASRLLDEKRLGRIAGGFLQGMATTAAMLLLAISETRGVSEFLYFNF
jgi:D-alanyl-lipoteichoic acid acyltransferase DltB (MBOAT superfamily)